ncbi:hypothetical protein B0H21DRAFT_737576 [Amylocystis lapponica]|nr:hypothetical protein B0H21DRAFT_737576 [Amylocystis lapponica]
MFSERCRARIESCLKFPCDDLSYCCFIPSLQHLVIHSPFRMLHRPHSQQATVTCTQDPHKTRSLPIFALADGIDLATSVQRPRMTSRTTPPLPGPPVKLFPPKKYVAVAAQIVHYGFVSKSPMVARVVVTDYRGNIILDTLVRPTTLISDYRTLETGLQPADLARAPTFIDVRQQVATHIRDRIIVGYALWHFLSVMGLQHPAIDTRDIALFMPFRRTLKSKPNVMLSLATLVGKFMGRKIGQRGDVPVEQARAALDLFRSCEHVWEGVVVVGSWPCALPPEAYIAWFT